ADIPRVEESLYPRFRATLRPVACAGSLQSISCGDEGDEGDAGLNFACDGSAAVRAFCFAAIRPHTRGRQRHCARSGGKVKRVRLIQDSFSASARILTCRYLGPAPGGFGNIFRHSAAFSGRPQESYSSTTRFRALISSTFPASGIWASRSFMPV